MARTRSKTLTLLAIGCFGGLLMASASEAGQLEVLIGHYHCSANTEDGIVYVSFDGSGDVLLEKNYLYGHDFTLSTSPAETCGQAAAATHEVVGSLDCTTSPISSEIYDDGGFASNFDFVCRGNRNRVIHDLAGVAGHILGITAD